ncbi:MAG: SusC/RagA family TonB-linked outer membrane protein, partial [Bacteroidales bacterium]|nr:SusC/RagA family TonB-linked outer membrane protein [Bacteroidales bacterium]
MNRMKKMGVRHVVLLIMFLLSGALFAQEEVRGKVVDASGEPVPGVTVLEKGTTNGVATDIDGLFIIQINSKEAVLSFCFIGFQTKDLLAVGDLSLVILALEDRLIDELVVVGFKTQKKVNLTGSVSSVTSEILESKPVVNAAQALQGTMPGLIIQEDNSSPTSSGPSINIRGVGTFGSTSPLVLIDGIVGSFSNVNPSDIASISVLKDASSAAIYGSRGANGVILITTKKNAGGEGSIHYTMNYGWQNATDLPEYASSWEYAMMRNEALVNSGLAPKFTPEQIQGYKDGPEITPWIEEIYRVAAPQVNHNLSIAGGTKELGYLLSLGYQSQESLFDAKDLGLKRYNGRLSINSQVKEYLKVEGSMAFSRRDISDHSYWTDWLIEQSTRMPTIYPIIDENNNYTLASGSNANALARLREGGRTNYLYDEYTTNLSAELTLPYQFSLKGVFGGYVRNNNQHLFRKSMDYTPYSGGGDAEEVVQDNNQKETYLNNQLLLNYDNIFAKSHNVSGMLGVSSESSTWTNFQAKKIGVPGNENGVLSNGELTDEAGTNGSGGTWGINSLFGRVNYGYDDRYLFEVNFRYDQSSRFSVSNRDAFFPSFSGAWRVNQEQFMQQTEDWLSNLKFRASWGLVGNQEIGLYQYLPTVVLNNYAYSYGNNTATGAYFTDVNEDISWETSRIIDFGVDLGVFKNELSFTFDY